MSYDYFMGGSDESDKESDKVKKALSNSDKVVLMGLAVKMDNKFMGIVEDHTYTDYYQKMVDLIVNEIEPECECPENAQ